MKRKISSATDVVGVMPPSLTTHECVQPPVPTPAPGPTLELDVPLAWVIGAAKHALAVKVKHRGVPVVLAGHDCGMGIGHITMLPLPDPLTPLHILLSSRKVVAGAALVRAEKKPLALTGGDLLTPMLACGLVPVPLGVNSSHALASVDVGATPGDVGTGWAQTATELVELLVASDDPEHPIAASTSAELIARALPLAVGLVRAAAAGSSPPAPIGRDDWCCKLELVRERAASGGYDERSGGEWLPRRKAKPGAAQPEWHADPTAGPRPLVQQQPVSPHEDEPPL